MRGVHEEASDYALTKKKVTSFLQPKLLSLARKKSIHFVSIDETRPLSEQGPFDIILHKLTDKEWQQVLEDYCEEHPEVRFALHDSWLSTHCLYHLQLPRLD